LHYIRNSSLQDSEGITHIFESSNHRIMTLILSLLTILISLSCKNFIDAHGDDHAIRYGNNNYVCRTKDSREGVEGKDFEKYDINNQKCEAECTKKHWCEAMEIKKDTSHCKLWYYKPPKLESKNGYMCKHKLYDDLVCRTKNGGKGEEGIDYKKYQFDNQKCENICDGESWCKAVEYTIGTERCELWYYKPPRYESKDGDVCKWIDTDDNDDHEPNDDDFFLPPPLSPCEEAQEEGYNAADYLFWDEFYEDCDNIFEFAEKASKDLLKDRFAGEKCARDGVKNSIDEWYEKCLNPAECNEYGQLAAELVINDFCRIGSYRAIYENKKIKRACKEEARRKCRGSLYSTIEDLVAAGYKCPKMDSYNDHVDDLREECRVTVLELMET